MSSLKGGVGFLRIALKVHDYDTIFPVRFWNVGSIEVCALHLGVANGVNKICPLPQFVFKNIFKETKCLELPELN